MKLKTLKDLEIEVDKTIAVRIIEKITKDKSEHKIVEVSDLKSEAVKWIKHSENNRFQSKTYCSWSDYDKNQNLPIHEAKYLREKRKYLINWIKHFFNLTPQDLNNEKA